MMKKLIIPSLLLGMTLPIVTMAAYNDVSLGTSAIVSINDSLGNAVTLNVTGSADVVESISVGATSFSVTLQPSSTLTVTDSGRHLITVEGVPAANVSISCSSSNSSVTLSSVSASDITASVSVSPNACGSSSSTSATGANGPVAQSGGGGGGGTYVAPTTSNSNQESQIADLKAAVATLQSQIKGGTSSLTFTKNLSVGSKGSEVMSLQKLLNSDPDTRVALTGPGSPGKETNLFGGATRKAIQKFQVKYGIAKPGGPGYGNFGPKTRAKMSEIAKPKSP